jgi:tagatose-6-phosphate ketose/aldose isomerase
MSTALNALQQLSEEEQKRRGVRYTPHEIGGQVVLWEDSVGRIERRLDEIRSFLEPFRAEPGTACVLTGAGTSEFIGHCVEALFRNRLSLATNVFSTTRIVTNPEELFVPGRKHLMISFARSGNSPESVGAVRIADGSGGPVSHLVVTCSRKGALFNQVAGRDDCLAVDLHPKTNDRGLAMTSSFSNMVIAAQALAHAFDFGTIARYTGPCVSCGRRALQSAPDVVQRVCELDFDRAVFLGSGSNLGTAIESHLKLQELTSGSVMCTYDSFPGLRHGPEAVVNDRTLVVGFVSRDPYVRRYELDLLEEIRRKGLGKAVLLSCSSSDDSLSALSDFTVEYNPEERYDIPDGLTPPIHVITGQLLGLFKSIQLGYSPDSPSEHGVINRVVKGVRVYDPVSFRKRGVFDILAER